GDLWCWGNDRYGQLGREAAQARDEVDAQVPRPANGLPDGVSFTQVAPGGDFTCALDTKGAIWCWGFANAVTLRAGEPRTCETCNDVSCLSCGVAPRVKVSDQAFTTLATGQSHACGLDEEGRVWCW